MTAEVSIDGRGDMPDYWSDNTFDADVNGFYRKYGDLWQRVAEGKRRD